MRSTYMYKMLIVIFCVLLLSGFGATSVKSGHEQACFLPCSWKETNFDVYINIQGPYQIGTMNVSQNGQELIYTDSFLAPYSVEKYQCFQIVNKYIIMRSPNTDKFACAGVEYVNGTQMKFKLSLRFSVLQNYSMPLNQDHICRVCNEVSIPHAEFYLAQVTGLPIPDYDEFSKPRCDVLNGCPTDLGSNACPLDAELQLECDNQDKVNPDVSKEEREKGKNCRKHKKQQK